MEVRLVSVDAAKPDKNTCFVQFPVSDDGFPVLAGNWYFDRGYNLLGLFHVKDEIVVAAPPVPALPIYPPPPPDTLSAKLLPQVQPHPASQPASQIGYNLS